MLGFVVNQLDHDASALLGEALAQKDALHLPGARTLHRARLERVLMLTSDVLADGSDESTLAGARLTRVLAQAARARDARHGAGQLSRSAQRAPTSEDCELGWGKVEAIVRGAEDAAADAKELAVRLQDPRADEAARSAMDSAEEARRIVERRNHAYTFHTDPGFSFGEGWYVAAAGVLANAQIQLEAGQAQTEQGERFLLDAGLEHRVVPYRSRPRANKALPALIARAFAEDSTDAQRCLRAAFLGDVDVDPEIAHWTERALADTAKEQNKVLVWVRHGEHDASRNSLALEVVELCRLARERALVPVLFGDAMEAPAPSGAVDLTLCWKLPLFQGLQMRRAQLQLFEHLAVSHRVVGQVGVTTAGMDGPALMGLPTMYVTGKPNPRLGRWVGAVPGYEEVVRTDDYLERIGATFSRWVGTAEPRLRVP